MKLPKRPRSHQIEDKSITAFRALMPEHWVVREKGRDYGIDLEVEIFDANDTATGAIFYVQLKATDTIFEDDKGKLQMKVGSLAYYKELDCPVLIARYSASDDRFLYRWAHEVSPSCQAGDQKTTTVEFSENHWNDFSSEGIANTVLGIRELKRLPTNSVIPMKVEVASDYGASSTHRVNRNIRQFIQELPGFTYNGRKHTEPGKLVVLCKIDNDQLFFSANGLFPTTIHTLQIEAETIHSPFAYGLCTFLNRSGLISRAIIVANLISSKNLLTDNRQLAFCASAALLDTEDRAVALAKINSLHTQVDEWNTLFVAQLLHRGSSHRIYHEYMLAMIDAMSSEAPKQVIGPMYYNLGNNSRANRDFCAAIRHFNIARKLDPEYLLRPYFCQELGACCFLSGRYQLATTFYRILLEMEKSDINHFLLGDALLFSGQLTEAHDHYSAMSFDDKNTTTMEAVVKLRLIEWLKEFTGQSSVTRKQTEAKKIYPSFSEGNQRVSEEVLEEYCKTVDPLDPLLNFNYAGDLVKSGNLEPAIMHYLVTAFTNLKDGPAWANAISCAFGSKAVPREFLISLISLSIFYSENELLEALADILEKKAASAAARDAVDELFEMIAQEVASEDQNHTPVVRLLNPSIS